MAKINIDIYIKETNGSTQVRIPWLPASIEYQAGALVSAKYDIMSKGTVEIPTGTGLAKISFSSQLPGTNRTDKSLMRGSWQKPDVYHKLFTNWMKKKTKLNIIVTGYPINIDVYLSSYKATPGGGFGDIEYTVEFTEIRTITVTSQKITTTKRPSKTPKTYTIKKGDSLWKIAKKFLGSGKKWKELYKANKKIIEKVAKQHKRKSSSNGKYIYPGTKIKIPTKTTQKAVKAVQKKGSAVNGSTIKAAKAIGIAAGSIAGSIKK